MGRDEPQHDPMLAGDAAKYLGISRQRVHFLTKEGRLKPTEVGGVAFYSKAVLDAYKVERDAKDGTAPPSPVGAVI